MLYSLTQRWLTTDPRALAPTFLIAIPSTVSTSSHIDLTIALIFPLQSVDLPTKQVERSMQRRNSASDQENRGKGDPVVNHLWFNKSNLKLVFLLNKQFSFLNISE